MRHFILLLTLIVIFSSCDNTTEIKSIKEGVKLNLVPIPKEVSVPQNILLFSENSKIYSENQKLLPLLNLFQNELSQITEFELGIAASNNNEADIIFEIDNNLANDEYHIIINKTIQATGGSYQALTMARTTLLQLANLKSGKLYFPMITLKDQPDAKYRGLMIDLARSWHDVETIKKLIDLSSFYKTNYLHLHFSDYQSYTLPSKAFPKLSTPDRHYSFNELEELEAYSQLRGITIIPEIDIPGHSSSIVNAYPEIFAIQAIEENPWIINMGKEEVYTAIDTIIGEIVSIFKASPYLHIGGDEAIFYKTLEDPFVQDYIKVHRLDFDEHELYRHFIVRVNDMVKRHGKQMCVWEGFGREGKVQIPKDIIVYEFETNRYLPNHLVEDGYMVVNTSWKPLYVVNKKKWEPKTIYGWNMWRWENWFPGAPSIIPIQLEETPLIIGAQMCAWEQSEEVEFPSLRKRLPVLNERIWNTEEVLSYDKFLEKLELSDAVLSILVNDREQDKLLFNHNYVDDREQKLN